VWSIAVIIYTLGKGRYPFEVAKESDYAYKLIADGNYATFWAKFDKDNDLSPGLRSLLESLLCPEESRLSMEALRAHPWI